MSKNLKTASQNIVVSNTLSEYRRYVKYFYYYYYTIQDAQHLNAFCPGCGSSSNSFAATLTE